MGYAALIISALCIIAFITTMSTIKANKKLRQKLISSFGKAPVNNKYRLDSVYAFHVVKRKAANTEAFVDDITWNDLDMDYVFERINACCSSIGDEYLFHILHSPCFEESEINKREAIISYLKEHEETRLAIQTALAKLGKSDFNCLTTLMDKQNVKTLKKPIIFTILAYLPLAAAVLLLFNIAAGTLALISTFIINMAVHFPVKKIIEHELLALEYFRAMLFCCETLFSIKDESFGVFLKQTKADYDKLKKLKGLLPSVANQSFSDYDAVTEYIRIIFLSDLRSYNKAMKHIKENTESLSALYEALGELDSTISILSFRLSLPFYCAPLFHNQNYLEHKELYHPLLESPVANDGFFTKSCIITGSNASGKSTFIKAVAINGILAQTINTCTAKSFDMRPSLVITSMAVSDNISEGDSYFVTEIKSLKRILDKVKTMPCLCFIDEILKGTNTIERIAASGAVLEYLQDKNCLCMVASHDIELTQMLQAGYDNYHFCEQISDDNISFDYLLKPNATKTSNAIKLLRYIGFDNSIVNSAQEHVDSFTKTKSWV